MRSTVAKFSMSMRKTKSPVIFGEIGGRHRLLVATAGEIEHGILLWANEGERSYAASELRHDYSVAGGHAQATKNAHLLYLQDEA
jgi:hypothetical protein